MFKLGIIGYGKMGRAIISALITSSKFLTSDIIAYDLFKENIIKDNINLASCELNVYENCNILILATKPQQYSDVINKINKSNNKSNLIISIAAGINLNYLKENLGDNNYIRVMPNLAAEINMAVTTLSYNNIDLKYVDIAKEIFETIGSVYIVKEEDINKLIPIQGSFPAYIWYFINEYIKSAMDVGISYNDALKIISSTTIGCCNMLLNTDTNLDTLIKNVCSKNGTTIEGVNVFNEYDLEDIIKKCYNACLNRAIQLEKEEF